MSNDLSQETFFIYYLDEEGTPLYLSEPFYMEGQIAGWELTESPGKAYGFPTLDEAGNRAKEMTFYSADLSEAFGERPCIEWLVRPCKLYLEPL